MADKFDALMKNVADEADAKVDYAAMREAILQKAAAERRKRARFVRYGAMAATLVILAGAGTLFLHAKGGFNASMDNCAPPQAAAFAADSVKAEEPECAPAENPSEPAPEPVPESTDRAAAPGEASNIVGGTFESATDDPPRCSTSGAAEEEPARAMNTEELVALCRAAEENESASNAALAAFEWLYVPTKAAEVYRLLDIVADASGITFTYNRAAAETWNDEYSIFIPAESLSGTRAETDAAGVFIPAETDVAVDAAGALTWALGSGKAVLTPCAGCTLSEAELRALCALRLVEIE